MSLSKEEVGELSVLIDCIKKILSNSRSYNLSVLIRAKKACDKNNLTTYSTELELKIEKAGKIREKNQKRLVELEKKGLKIDSPVKCKNCFTGRKTCHTTVAAIKEGYILVNCKEALRAGDELPFVEALKIELVMN
jgi:hypothetical protein